MLKFNKYFQAEGTESGKTDTVEEESLLIEDEPIAPEVVEDKPETIEKPTETPSSSDEPDYDLELDRLKATITKKEVATENKTEADDLLSDKTEAPKPAASKVDDGTVTINDAYIKSQPEEHQAILRSVLGKRKEALTDAKLLKNHIQAELHIRELKAGKEQPASVAEQADQSGVAFQPENTDATSIDKAANAYLVQMLKAKYPNLTEDDLKDEDSIEEYVAQMQTHSPLKASKFIGDYDKANATVTQRKEQFSYLSKNWEQIDRATVVDTVKKFDNWLKKAGVNAADLGIKYTEKFILDNFITPNNKPDNDVVVYADRDGQIPIVLGHSLLRKMKEHYEELVFDRVKSSGRIEGIENRNRMEPPGSISGGDHRERSSIEKPIETQIRDDMTSEEMDAVLEKQKERIQKQKVGA